MTQSNNRGQPIHDENTHPISKGADEQRQTWAAFLLDAYVRYQDTVERTRRPYPGLTNYDIIVRINAVNGTRAWLWGSASEVRETINSLNAWGVRLHQWQAWNDVVSSYAAEEDGWKVLHHFLEPVAFYCMFQPSSFADRLRLTAENLLHQANQRTAPEEPDHLVQDARPGKFLRRPDQRKQLGKLGHRWLTFPVFQQALYALNGDQYRQLTRNYRDLAAHAFSPHLMMGHITRATRSIVPQTYIVRQDDGSYLPTEHPIKKAASYARVCQEPLSLEETFKANLAEYELARKAIESFITLARELCDAIDAAGPPSEKNPWRPGEGN